MLLAETFTELVKDPNHWYFEIMLMVIFDILIGAIAWPFIKSAIRRHDERKHPHKCAPSAEDRIAILERKIQSLEWAESMRMDDGR